MNDHPLVQLFFLSSGTFLLAFAVTAIPALSAARRHLVWQVAFAVVAASSPLILLSIQLPVPILSSAPVEVSLKIDTPSAAERMESPITRAEPSPTTLPLPIKRFEIPWNSFVWSLWAFGVMVTSARLLFGGCKLKGILRRARLVGFSSRAGALTPEAANGIPVFASSEVGFPMTIGVRSPAILLPQCLVEKPDNNLRHVLLHESTHARLSDVRFLLLAGLTRSLHWPNPLVWLAVRQLKRTAEAAADDAALQASDSAEDYAASLLSIVRRLKAVDTKLFPAVAMAGTSDVSRRVKRLLNKELDRSIPAPRTRWLAFVVVLTCAVAGLVIRPVAADPLPGGQTQPDPASTPVPTSPAPTPAQDEQQIEISFKLLELAPETFSKNRDAFDRALNSTSKESLETFLRFLNKLEGADLLSAPKVTTRSRQSAIIQIVREFSYPVEFDDMGVPTGFETKDLGVTFEVEPRWVKERTILSGNLQITDFLGFVDDQTKTPTFQTREARIYRELKKGEAAVMLVPWQVQQSKLAPKFSRPPQLDDSEQADRRLIFILTADPVPKQIRLAKEDGEKYLSELLATTVLRDRNHHQAAVTDVIGGMLGEIMETDGSGVQIAWDFFIIGEVPKVSFEAGGLTAKQALEEIRKQTGIAYRLEGGMIVVGTPEQLAARANNRTANALYGTPVNGKPGFVTSPHAPTEGYVDVRGYPPGASVSCPYTNKLFLVP